MSEHTKGEWFLDFDIISTEPHRKGKIIASVIFGQVGAAEAKANACLIVAAPDLLAALKENYEFTKYAAANKKRNTDEYMKEFFIKGESAQKAAKAAIAKAKGD